MTCSLPINAQRKIFELANRAGQEIMIISDAIPDELTNTLLNFTKHSFENYSSPAKTIDNLRLLYSDGYINFVRFVCISCMH